MATRARKQMATTEVPKNGKQRGAKVERNGDESAPIDLDDPSLYLNRELSWLEFNRRVLEEALDPSAPLLERLKFLAIFSSNLDEFFMVRVASLKQKVASDITTSSGGDRLKPRDQLKRISVITHELVAQAFDCLREELFAKLAENGIRMVSRKELSADERVRVDEMFTREICPVLTPLAIDTSHPFPHLSNNSLNLAIRLRRKKQSKARLALVQVPSVLPRFVVLPDARGGVQVQPLEAVIRKYLKQLFPGMEILDSFVFRVTRDSDFDLDDYEEIKDLVETIERHVRDRRRGAATRLEIEEGAPPDLIDYLCEALDLKEQDVYKAPGPLDLKALFEIHSLPGYEHLRDADFVPGVAPEISNADDLWTAIRDGDMLLHHPYDSFKPVVDFINHAADDPNVLAIKQTLYRTSRDSAIIRALKRAADRGKQVTALIELQARLDEERNIEWSRELEKGGVHVVYGFVGIKTHCKVSLVVRREEDQIRRYVHLATGNYNPETARLYTDVGLFTCNEQFVEDASALFNYLTGYSEIPEWHKLILAPSRMKSFVIESIEHEASLGAEGRIVAKLNAILEPDVIAALYRASQAGVRIDLICRGICGLRPGVPGVSDNIRVISIVDRFLEHSRIFYFGAGGTPKLYMGSADWMDRNLIRRIEVIFPIEDPALRARLLEILAISLADNVKARQLQSDGTWRRVEPAEGAFRLRSQQYFLDLVLQRDGKLELDPPFEAIPLIDSRVDPSQLKTSRRKRHGKAERSGFGLRT